VEPGAADQVIGEPDGVEPALVGGDHDAVERRGELARPGVVGDVDADAHDQATLDI
jgi:hypothetical protein